MTAAGADEGAQAAVQMEATAWVSKPFDVNDLLELVGRYAPPK